ncbi:hypothetical protein [Macrococcus epidermidis]|uniref:hypothetical protein n=1 Tax=Macrococcus epidermidis TaxID=1902580 RepID=UPI001473B8B7|nr:hypothetical protein [Macrococcus epidermidis]
MEQPQRNFEKELGIYQVEYMQLKAENVSLKAQVDDLQNELQQLNKKDEAVSQ